MLTTIASNNQKIARIHLFVFLVMPLFLLPSPALASGPVVCKSGSGNINLTNFALSTCGVNTTMPVYVELHAFSVNNAPAVAITEGSLSCSVSIPKNTTPYPCAVTVSDGVLDAFSVGNAPDNYRLIVYPTELYSLVYSPLFSQSLSPQNIVPTSFYTRPLSSGNFISIERILSYGEMSIAVFLLVLISMAAYVSLKGIKVKK